MENKFLTPTVDFGSLPIFFDPRAGQQHSDGSEHSFSLKKIFGVGEKTFLARRQEFGLKENEDK